MNSLHLSSKARLFMAGVMALGLTACVISDAESDRRDEKRLREIFGLPNSVENIALESEPKASNWQREGLEIDATFQFSASDWEDYLDTHALDWQSLPIPDELLLKMSGIARKHSQTQDLKNQQTSDAAVSTPEETALTQWKQKLPQAAIGKFVCLTAGDNLLYEPTTNCRQYTKRFHDFIVAVLDEDSQQLKIKLQTYY